MYNRKSFEEILAAQNATTPRRKPRDEEHQIQCACVKWFNLQYPQYRGLLFAVPNGGARSKATAGKLKAEGVVAGVADLILLVPRFVIGNYNFAFGLCLETKSKTGRQTPEQKEWQKKVEEQRFAYIVYRSFDEFKDIIERWFSAGRLSY